MKTYISLSIHPESALTRASVHPDGKITCITFAGDVARLQFSNPQACLEWLNDTFKQLANVVEAARISATT